ncbi:MAG: leucyl aminopeptidase family protein [Bacteroidales bacterium]
MKTEVSRISQISPDQSVVCIIGKDEIPGILLLSKPEKEYAKKRIAEKEEHVIINSYFKTTYLIRTKEGIPDYKIREELRKTASNLKAQIKSNDHSELVITSDNTLKGASEAFAEGLLLSSYSFGKYKTRKEKDKKRNYPSRLLLHGDIEDMDLKWLNELTEAVYMVRDLINEPVNHLNAPALGEEIKKMGRIAGFSVEVLNKGKIEALKMGGLLAVNKGSVDPPVFCILEWKPENHLNSAPLVLVGKGVVYDTGGLNIKTGDYMDNMKGDMAGAAAITGVLYTIAKTGIPLHVIGLVPSTDNRPGGNAYTQGDIIKMHNKMSVEIGNTDAEGRLILADAISYASRFKPELIIDIATLTGSAAMTFGNLAIAVMGNADKKFFRLLEECGNEVYERTAELPFWEEYGEMIKSDMADIKNVGGREAGAITAGKFLENFAEYPMIHLDIAGPGALKKDDFYRIKDGPGSGLRLLATFVKKLAEDYRLKK